MTHPGELSERVQAAHNDLIEFRGSDDFEAKAQEILSNLSTRGGDWSKVTKEQYSNVAAGVLHYVTQLREDASLFFTFRSLDANVRPADNAGLHRSLWQPTK
jgi:hypothetical protein